MRTRMSRTYILHKGKKVYLNDTFWELKEKLRVNDVNVTLQVSGLFSDKEKSFLITNIHGYGRA